MKATKKGVRTEPETNRGGKERQLEHCETSLSGVVPRELDCQFHGVTNTTIRSW